ncbi:MAG: tandem-95 repeat protein, partial [Candidatus Neomarinimicrobiota bacterium]
QIPPRPIEDHYNDSHVYDYYFTGTNEPISVVFNDSGYGDNGGTLTFKFYEIESNRPPTTDDVNASIDENRNSFRLANISLVGNDPDGDNLTYSLVTTPQNGSYSIDGNILTYEPNKDWYGYEVFTYKANDGNLDSNTSTITITVNSVNDTPIINSGSSLYLDGVNDYAYISAENNNIDLANSDFTLAAWVVLEGLDASTNAATIMSTGIGSNNQGLYFMINNDKLALEFYGDGLETSSSIDILDDNTWHHVVATFDESSKERKLYLDGALVATDNSGSAFLNNSTNFTIGATAWNFDDNFEGYIDEAAIWNEVLNDSQIGSLANDSKNPLEVGTASAYWEFEPDTNNPTNITDLTLNGNNLQNNGSIETNGTNITTSVLEDTSVNIQLYANDVDGDALSYSIVDSPTNGSTSINSNIITYTPNENYFGTDTFTYKASDGILESDAASVDVTVIAVNDAPVTTNQSVTAITNQTLDITLTSTDIESDSVTYSIVSDVSNGSTSLNGAVVTYTPNTNFSGSDSFTFKANDGTDDSNTSTVTINVSSSIINVPNDYSNIQDAINNASDGTKIIVASGTYNVN